MVLNLSEIREAMMRHWKTTAATLLIAALAGGSSAFFASAAVLAQNTVKFELWSRQDPSGPLRPANVVKAADRLNKDLAAEGSGKRVEVAVHESPAPGFDDDALQLLKVFGIGRARICSSPRMNGSAPSSRKALRSSSTITSPNTLSISARSFRRCGSR